MARKRSLFTPEQVQILQSNPAVDKVSEKTVRFTPRFKENFYQQYTDGARPEDIFRAAGVDPEILGELRIRGFCQNLNTKVNEGGDFADRRYTRHELAVLRSRVVSLAERVARLEKLHDLNELPGKPFARAASQGAQGVSNGASDGASDMDAGN